jgi:peptidoglycan/xylan/chitin deacetylase (PgdA/CDA1 family)
VVDRQQIAQLSSEKLIAIGSHGVSHGNSCRLSDEEFRREVVESKKALEDITNNPITSFSFPHGKYANRHLDILQAAGYAMAFSIDPSVEQLGKDKFLLGRVSVNPDDWRIEFYLKVLGAYRWQHWISRQRNNCP